MMIQCVKRYDEDTLQYLKEEEKVPPVRQDRRMKDTSKRKKKPSETIPENNPKLAN